MPSKINSPAWLESLILRTKLLDEQMKIEQNSRLSYYEIRVDELIANPTSLFRANMGEPNRMQKIEILKKACELYILRSDIRYRKINIPHHEDWIEYNTNEWETCDYTVKEPFLLLAQFLLYVDTDLSKL